jgi:hypothetical protein
VQDAFGYVLFAVVIVGVIVAVVTFFMSGKAYDQIGKGGFYRDDRADMSHPPGSVNLAERDDEIRQMLTARNTRRAAAGLEQVDVEEELARLVAPQIDAELAAEIREHVVARNARRIRRGQEPLDVDAEVARQIEEFG